MTRKRRTQSKPAATRPATTIYWRVMGMGNRYPAPPRDWQDRADVACTIAPREAALPLPRMLPEAKPRKAAARAGGALDQPDPWRSMLMQRHGKTARDVL